MAIGEPLQRLVDPKLRLSIPAVLEPGRAILINMTYSATPFVAAPAHGDPRPDAGPFDVAIIGNGLTGLALSLALADGMPTGTRIALLDRNTPTTTANKDARAVALAASSVRLLTALGVWREVSSAAQPVSSFEITDSALSDALRTVRLAYDAEIGQGETSAYIVPNAALEAALASACAARPELIRTYGATVAGFTAGPDVATVTFADGRSVKARLVAAADGRRSKLRELAGIGIVGWPYRQRGITVAIAHSAPHHGKAVQHFLPGGPFAMLPLPGDRSCITWSEDEREAALIMAMSDDAFLAEIDQRVAGRLGTLRLDGPRQSWPLESFLARSFVARRLALVGDAAHAVHPIAGQGLNLGLKDVAALAEVIVDVVRAGLDPGAPDALTRYERWRRFDAFTAAASFDALNRLFSNDSGILRAFRTLGLEMVHDLPFLKRGLVAEAAGTTGSLPRLVRGEAL